MGRVSQVVDVDWLVEHLDRVVVLDASVVRAVGEDGRTSYSEGSADFERGHVPGAVPADLVAAFSDPAHPVPFMRPSAARFEAAARAVGVREGSTVVAYDRLSGAWAARLWWVFRSFGFDGIRVLDGGLAAWTSAGRPLATGRSPAVAPGDVVARPRDGWFVDADAVVELSRHPDPRRPVVCAVRREEYLAGHVPGSSSLPYPDLLLPDGTLSLAAVHAAARQLSLGEAERTTLYCGGAINAAGVALALTEAGYEHLTIYDGSLSEWRADPARPLATGADDGVLVRLPVERPAGRGHP
jgi:thiosulfate/3-mercaptopyruvate sulfurtransferase